MTERNKKIITINQVFFAITLLMCCFLLKISDIFFSIGLSCLVILILLPDLKSGKTSLKQFLITISIYLALTAGLIIYYKIL